MTSKYKELQDQMHIFISQAHKVGEICKIAHMMQLNYSYAANI